MPKIVDHEQRRQEIAAAAARVIAERGVDEVTMIAIGEAAGMTTGAVTHYFADKDEVILAALRWADSAMRARAQRAFETHDDVVSIVLEVLPTDRASRIEWIVWGVFSERAARSRALMNEQRARNQWWLELTAAEITRQQREGHVDPGLDAELEAKLSIVMINGLGFLAAYDPESWPEAEQRRVLEHYFQPVGPWRSK